MITQNVVSTETLPLPSVTNSLHFTTKHSFDRKQLQTRQSPVNRKSEQRTPP